MKPFIRTKVIKGKEYLYEVTPYYDPETGKWRQKTRYLGKNVDGEPVKRSKSIQSGQIFDLGQYLPAFWAVREYKIFESLLTSCSPGEAATLVLLAINRLVSPCPPENLNSWAESTYLSRLIHGAEFESEDLVYLLQKVTDRPVVEVFSTMFSNLNNLADQKVLFTLKLHDIPEMQRETGSGLFSEEMVERQLGVRIQYDHEKNIPAGCEVFQFQRSVIEDSIEMLCSGRVPEGVIVSHWDYLSPSLMLRLVNAGCSFITRADATYAPILSHILNWSDQMDHPANIRYYNGEACYIRPFSTRIGKEAIPGYILHDIKKEQVDRLAFHKNLQNIRDLIQETRNYDGTMEDLLNETAGHFRPFFTLETTGGLHSFRTNQKAVSEMNQKLGRTCVLYQGDFSWEDCFDLVDLRGQFEHLMSIYVSQFERDFFRYKIDRIRKGIFFVAFLTVLLRHLIRSRLEAAHFPDVISFEALQAELLPIHVIKSYHPMIFPQKLNRRQKSILSFFGGIPSLVGE